MNNLRKKIELKEKIRGSIVSLTDPGLCEIIAASGFDCVWIDMEHTYIDCKELYSHVLACKAEDVSVIVRVPQHDYDTLKRVLEMGVDGIVFPMPRNVAEAADDIAHTLYPPLGVRGFGPRRAIRYGMDDVDTYLQERSLDICRFVQLEHIKAIEELEEIIKIPYIDGFIFGPCDLAGSIGQPGKHLGSDATKIMTETTAYLKKNGKYCGLSIGDYSMESVRHWSEMGMDMISAGADTDFLLAGARQAYENLARVHLKAE